MSSFYRYWGKAKPAEESGASYHLLPYHCLDVAAVAEVLWEHSPQLRHGICSQLYMPPESTKRLLLFLIALHDLGKFSSSFQVKNKYARKSLQPQASTACSRKLFHDALGLLIGKEVIGDMLKNENAHTGERSPISRVRPLIESVMGHHGVPVSARAYVEEYFTSVDKKAVMEFIDELCKVFEIELSVLLRIKEKSAARVSLLLAGFMMLCDWAGSHQGHFPYETREMALGEYYGRALEQATVMIATVGLIRPEPTCHGGMEGLFPGYTPRPMQSAADHLQLEHGPQLVILEDMTGSGKTEAAMILAHSLMRQGQGRGLYIGLPTMATADQMYDRMAACYEKLFAGKTSLVLAHGARALSEKFTASIGLESTGGNDALREENETAGVMCTAWLADHAKKALLATVGVGTVDQAMQAVLRKRHAPMRLLGLVDKVLIIDEIHAYDAYMTAIIARLLEIHAAHGGSAILLSATLPEVTRRRYLEAFARGGGHETIPAFSEDAYPLITHLHDTNLTMEAVRPSRHDVVKVVLEDSLPYDRIVAQAEAGRCVCWIRNTVDDAIDAYDELCTRLGVGRVMLFHARFAMVDRLRIQSDVLERFGAESTAAMRGGRVLIATQVVEQSLDVDFDRVISDLAPIDLLIQRLGRQMRHARDEEGNRAQVEMRGEKLFEVVVPDWTEVPDKDWYKSRFPRGHYVYKDQIHLLWLTHHTLRNKPLLHLPLNARLLIESVYDPNVDLPDGLIGMKLKWWNTKDAKDSRANKFIYNPRRGYAIGPELRDDDDYGTRLGDHSMLIRLAISHENTLKPYAGCDVPRAFSDIRLPKSWFQEMSFDKHDLGPWIDGHSTKKTDPLTVPLITEKEGEVYSCSNKNQSFCFSYDKTRGAQRKGMRQLDGI